MQRNNAPAMKVTKKINHFNGKSWFEVIEMECGTTLAEFDNYDDAIKEMNRFTLPSPDSSQKI